MMKGPQAPFKVWQHPTHLAAFGFGAGTIRFAPGTWGTLVAVPPYLLMQHLSIGYYIAIVMIMVVVGVWLCQVTARDMGVHDHPGIVWDEMTGFMVAMTASPSGWVWVLLGFLLFRLFDIWKPWPIYMIDRAVVGGFGIMLDDIIAGLYAMLSLQSIYWVMTQYFGF